MPYPQSDLALQAEICSGAALSIVLQPDHDVMRYSTPTYNENYDLPFVFCNEGLITGVTRPSHLYRNKKGTVHLLGFSYTNTLPIYAIIGSPDLSSGTDETVSVTMNSKNQYKIHEFVTRPFGYLVYEATRDPVNGVVSETDKDAIKASIQAGAKFRITIQKNSGNAWSLPVEIAYDYFTENSLVFTTEAIPTSRHCLHPKQFYESVIAQNPNSVTLMSNPHFNAKTDFAMELTYLKVLDDGRFMTWKDEALNTSQTWDNIQVFSDTV